MLQTAVFNTSRFSKELEGDFSLATDLADWLVQKQVPFREAHSIVGKLVKKLEDERKNFKSVDLSDLITVSKMFDKTALECLNMESALRRKKTSGSPNPEDVNDRIEYWKKKLI